jgi:hypothetical protein
MTEKQLITKIAIEIAIAASKTGGYHARLDHDDFPAVYDAVQASKSDGAMNVYVEAARAILELTKQES